MNGSILVWNNVFDQSSAGSSTFLQAGIFGEEDVVISVLWAGSLGSLQLGSLEWELGNASCGPHP
jgi:hypothetical protein